MTSNEFEKVGWRHGMRCRISKDGNLKEVKGVNFEHRVLLLADSKNIQNWYFYNELEVVNEENE